MSALWTAGQIAAATGGSADRDWSVTGVSIDTRSIAPGDLFVALVGPNNDAHEFVQEALSRGAGGALVTHRPEGVAEDAPLVTVADTLDALTTLGAEGRLRAAASVIGVTGSVGKTSVKEALRHVLSEEYVTHASAASHNNHWGVPLTLARLPCDAHYAIIEMGMNRAGEIADLARLAVPHVALITRIAPAHLGHFSSVEAIADAKAELFEGLEAGGVAVLNRDDEYFDRLKAAAKRRDAPVITFGAHVESDWRLVDARLEPRFSEVEVELEGRRLHYRLGLPGRHQVENSLAVLASVGALCADVDAAAAALADLPAAVGRGRFRPLNVEGGEATLLDESYNANPASMRAAIELLGRQPGRRIAVLGDMLELGPASPALHRELTGALDAAEVDLVFTCGSLTQELNRDLPRERVGDHKPTSDLLADAVRSALRPGDVVLVKGSLGSRMAVIVDALTRDGTAPTEAG